MRIGIVADDLTGAADAAAPFASRGMRCGTLIGEYSAAKTCLAGYDVASVSTETRDLSAGSSKIVRSAIVNAVGALETISLPEILYKKIDSTLRGNIAMELEAICDLAPDRIPIICPAFPAQGRTVVNRKLIVRGETRHWVFESFNPEMSLYGDFLDLSGIRRGAEWVCRRLDKMVSKRAVFFDAETDHDLAIVAAAVLQSPKRWLPVGSAGFISSIAGQIGRKPIEESECLQVSSRFASHPVLYICGSKSSVSRNQIAELERAASITRVSTVGEAIDEIASGSRIAIAASPHEEQDRAIVLENLLTGFEALDSVRSVSLFITGGATAAALIIRLPEFSHLDVLGELESGVVMTDMRFQSSGNLHVDRPVIVIKAGAFGDARTMARIAGL